VGSKKAENDKQAMPDVITNFHTGDKNKGKYHQIKENCVTYKKEYLTQH
jgi:hypothetical protein